MKKGLEKQFNQEVDGYRKALLYHARISDWETFKAKAGKLFDYVEAVECSELERRFFTTFYLILVVLIMIVVALFKVDFAVTPELIRFKNSMVLACLGVSSFELYFYIDYKLYRRVKAVYYQKRRKNFIGNIEKDFKMYASQNMQKAA